MKAWFKLVPEWKQVLLRAWSVWLGLIAIIFMAAEVAVTLGFIDLPFSPSLRLVITMVVQIGGIVARVVMQRWFEARR